MLGMTVTKMLHLDNDYSDPVRLCPETFVAGLLLIGVEQQAPSSADAMTAGISVPARPSSRTGRCAHQPHSPRNSRREPARHRRIRAIQWLLSNWIISIDQAGADSIPVGKPLRVPRLPLAPPGPQQTPSPIPWIRAGCATRPLHRPDQSVDQQHIQISPVSTLRPVTQLERN